MVRKSLYMFSTDTVFFFPDNFLCLVECMDPEVPNILGKGNCVAWESEGISCFIFKNGSVNLNYRTRLWPARARESSATATGGLEPWGCLPGACSVVMTVVVMMVDVVVSWLSSEADPVRSLSPLSIRAPGLESSEGVSGASSCALEAGSPGSGLCRSV